MASLQPTLSLAQAAVAEDSAGCPRRALLLYSLTVARLERAETAERDANRRAALSGKLHEYNARVAALRAGATTASDAVVNLDAALARAPALELLDSAAALCVRFAVEEEVAASSSVTARADVAPLWSTAASLLTLQLRRAQPPLRGAHRQLLVDSLCEFHRHAAVLALSGRPVSQGSMHSAANGADIAADGGDSRPAGGRPGSAGSAPLHRSSSASSSAQPANDGRVASVTMTLDRALESDARGQYDEALASYCSAIDLMQRALLSPPPLSSGDQDLLRARLVRAIERAQQLEHYRSTGSFAAAPLGLAPGQRYTPPPPDSWFGRVLRDVGIS